MKKITAEFIEPSGYFYVSDKKSDVYNYVSDRFCLMGVVGYQKQYSVF